MQGLSSILSRYRNEFKNSIIQLHGCLILFIINIKIIKQGHYDNTIVFRFTYIKKKLLLGQNQISPKASIKNTDISLRVMNLPIKSKISFMQSFNVSSDLTF